jgi:hypothetical protein
MTTDINIPEMTLEDLVEKREEINQAIEEITAGVVVINQEILQRLNDMKVNGTIVGDKTVTKVVRTTFAPSVEEARALGATEVVTEEKLDQKMLRKLHESGATVPGTRTSEYIQVRLIEKLEEKQV